jgi:phosphoribosyl-ATP pyrophosphohydrolase/phosphoribosyl-AMP cyclohydrolase
MDPISADNIAYDERGLVPAIVQDDATGEVLMLAYMNQKSLQRTLDTGQTHFYSRSRQKLWHKGETSGNVQNVRWIRADCDADALLIGVEQVGDGACHVEGRRDCFFNAVEDGAKDAAESYRILPRLVRLIAARKREMPEGSYTATLFSGGVDRIGKKVGEEAVEVIIAAKNAAAHGTEEISHEMADLIYHLVVLAEHVELDLADIWRVLAKRFGS